jgi:large subunit ribosomal protein L17
MRHRIFGRQLNRTSNQRQALFRSQLRSLFTHGFITTTSAKAKSISSSAESLATLAVIGDLTSARRINKIFDNRHFVTDLINRMKTVFGDQKSNFFRSDKVGYRQGDNSLLVKLSLVKPFPKIEVSAKGGSTSGGKKEAKK